MPKMRAHRLPPFGSWRRKASTCAFGVSRCGDQSAFTSAMNKARLDPPHPSPVTSRGASHMAEGFYAPPKAGNIGVCIGTSGTGRHRHDHRALFRDRRFRPESSASPGQAPRGGGSTRKTFRAVDIEAIAKPVTKWAVTVRETPRWCRA